MEVEIVTLETCTRNTFPITDSSLVLLAKVYQEIVNAGGTDEYLKLIAKEYFCASSKQMRDNLKSYTVEEIPKLIRNKIWKDKELLLLIRLLSGKSGRARSYNTIALMMNLPHQVITSKITQLQRILKRNQTYNKKNSST